jgi:hypothetical protein
MERMRSVLRNRLASHVWLALSLTWLAGYAIGAAALAAQILPGAAWPVRVLFYALAGTLWIAPILGAPPPIRRENRQWRAAARRAPAMTWTLKEHRP